MVGAHEHGPNANGHAGAVGPHVAPQRAVNLRPHSQDDAITVGGNLQLTYMLPGVVGGDQVLHAVFDPLDWAAQFHGAERNDEVLRVELAADPETSANVGFNEVDTVFRHLQKRGQYPPVEVGYLGLAPHGHVAGPGGEGRHQTPSLQGVSGVPVAAKFLFAGVLRFGERAIRVPQRPLERQG